MPLSGRFAKSRGQPWLRNPVFKNISGRGVAGKENARFPADPYRHHQRICDRQGATDRSGDPECGFFHPHGGEDLCGRTGGPVLCLFCEGKKFQASLSDPVWRPAFSLQSKTAGWKRNSAYWPDPVHFLVGGHKWLAGAAA